MKNIILPNKIKSTLLKHYGLDVVSSLPTKSGLINHSFFIKTRKGKYVFRLYSKKRNKTKKDILFEVDVMENLKKSGFPVPEIYKNTAGEYVTTEIFNGKEYYSILMELIKGTNLKRTDFNMLKQVGELQARMHLFISKKIKPTQKISNVLKDWSRWSKEEIKKMQPILKEYKLEKIYLERFYETKNEMDIYIPKLLKTPYGECHNDFFGGNILISNKKVAGVIDFDNISTSPFVFDLANTLKSWLFSSNKNKYKTIYNNYLMGYQKYRKLSKEEMEILPTMIATRNFAVTNSLCTRNLIKSKERINTAIKFDTNWRNFINTNHNRFD